uniref:Uncharacterized protein n=1 Tax=Bicosoecida sp. CB-2014 TaxID=1486930 RepID=A0A7S1C4P6_9STRA|mmetsp:Transcript_1365/g.4302  ORF Transcript_1365/g.4302 Transcript_1365/m.4302 type:complete len:312 (+) Transcript_1365:344-1279(+)
MASGGAASTAGDGASGKPLLRALGFCGADDSTDVGTLVALSREYPHVEWGVLFRPDKEGTPRYASPAWVAALAAANDAAGRPCQLAGHLCGERVNEVLRGDASFVRSVAKLGFGRVQVNATAINGVDTTDLRGKAAQLRACMRAVPEVEWIVQRNEETRPLWEALSEDAPDNMSMLFDASCGTGVYNFGDGLPAPHGTIATGYAGGIGPHNVAQTLGGVAAAMGGRHAWIDMESSLRGELEGRDVFSIDRCVLCIRRAAGRFTFAGRRSAAACAPPCCGADGGAGGRRLLPLLASASAGAVVGALLAPAPK